MGKQDLDCIASEDASGADLGSITPSEQIGTVVSILVPCLMARLLSHAKKSFGIEYFWVRIQSR